MGESPILAKDGGNMLTRQYSGVVYIGELATISGECDFCWWSVITTWAEWSPEGLVGV